VRCMVMVYSCIVCQYMYGVWCVMQSA
jgi:hypothetical protein